MNKFITPGGDVLNKFTIPDGVMLSLYRSQADRIG
jgi:hypothetical protein